MLHYMKMHSTSLDPARLLLSPPLAKSVSNVSGMSGRLYPGHHQSVTGSGASELDTDFSLNESVLSLSSESVKMKHSKYFAGHRIETLSGSTSSSLSLHRSEVEELASKSVSDTVTSPLPGYGVSHLMSDISNYGAVHLVDLESESNSFCGVDGVSTKHDLLADPDTPMANRHDSMIQKSFARNTTNAFSSVHVPSMSASFDTTIAPSLSGSYSKDYLYSSDTFESVDPTTVNTSQDRGSQAHGIESPTQSRSRQEIRSFTSSSRESYSSINDDDNGSEYDDDEGCAYSDTFETSEVSDTARDHEQVHQSEEMKARDLVAMQLLSVLKKQQDEREAEKPDYTRKSGITDQQQKVSATFDQKRVAEFCERSLKRLKQKKRPGGCLGNNRMPSIAPSNSSSKNDVLISDYGLSSSVLSRLKMSCFMSSMAKVAETEIHDPQMCPECWKMNQFLDEEKAKQQFAKSVLHHIHNRETETRLCQHQANNAPIVLLGKLLEDLPRLSDDPREIMHRLNQPFYEYTAEKGHWVPDLACSIDLSKLTVSLLEDTRQ